MGAELRQIPTQDGLAYQLDLPAPPKRVWQLWTEPTLLVGWMGSQATLEPWPGGMFRLAYGNGSVATGTFLDVEPPQFLAFTWGWDEPGTLTPPGTSRIEIILEEIGSIPGGSGGGTRMHFRHGNQPSAAIENHDAGWRFFLPRLAEALAR